MYNTSPGAFVELFNADIYYAYRGVTSLLRCGWYYRSMVWDFLRSIPFTRAGGRVIAAAATNPRDALLIRIPVRTIMRIIELIGILVPDMNFDNRAIVIKVQTMWKRDGKVVERRRVGLTSAPWTW